MKYVKMLGLAAIAAAALMAFVGASSASATVLCQENPIAKEGEKTGTTCPATKAYPKETEIHAVLDPGTGNAKLVTAFKTIECSESTVKGKTSNEGGLNEKGEDEPVTGNVETLTFGGCNCEVKVLSGGTLSVSWISGTHNGTLKSSNAEVTTFCEKTLFGNVHCIYRTSATDIGVLTGGNPATMDIEKSNIPRLETNAICSEQAEWSAKYEVTSPKPLYVAGHT